MVERCCGDKERMEEGGGRQHFVRYGDNRMLNRDCYYLVDVAWIRRLLLYVFSAE